MKWGESVKYTVTAVFAEDNEVSVDVSVRLDARLDTVFRKCINTLGSELVKKGLLPPNAKYKYEKPNVWTNGAIGAAWFCDPFANVTIQQENGAWLAF